MHTSIESRNNGSCAGLQAKTEKKTLHRIDFESYAGAFK